MRLLLFLSAIIIFLINDCAGNSSGIVIERLKTSRPVKFSVGFSNLDSSRIRIYIPQELKISNLSENKIQHTKTSISISGGNIFDSGKNPLYEMADSLVRLPPRDYRIGDMRSYVFYAGYLFTVSNSERDSLIESGAFSQLKSSRKIYDLKGIQESSSYLNKKITDSLKGFLHLDFYNYEKEIGQVELVPIKF